MNAISLYKEGGIPVPVAACGVCGTVGTIENAEACCRCRRCKKQCEKFQFVHCECREQESREREVKRNSAARIVKGESEAMYYAEGLGYGAGDYATLEDILEQIEDGDKEAPEFIYCTRATPVQIDWDRILEWVLEDMWDDADQNDLNGVGPLKKAVEAFNEANKSVLVYEVDYSRKVRVPVEAGANG